MPPFVCRMLLLGVLVGTASALAAAKARADETPAFPAVAAATARRGAPAGGGPPAGLPPGLTGWSTSFRAIYLRQLESDIDDGGRVSVNRAFGQASVGYAWGPTRRVALSIGYRYDGYSFGGSGVFGRERPWDDVHSIRLGVPVFWDFGSRWTLFAVGTVRSTVESGAPLGDGVTGGGFAGVSYRFSDRFSLGPGFGALTEIEDDLSFFPIILVDWKITRKLSLKTGRGLGATQGPGLFLEYRPARSWELSLGGRYERVRFRLDDRGVAPGGVGDDRSFAALLSAKYKPNPGLEASLSVGLDFLGELKLEDDDGGVVAWEDRDSAIFFGLGFAVRM